MSLLVETVSVLATISVIVMELGPAPAIYEVWKTKRTGVTPLAPLVSLGTNGWMWSMYGYLSHNIFPVVVSNFTGAVLAVGYTAVFYRYTHDRAYARKVIGVFLLMTAAATAYAVAGTLGYTGQTREQVQRVLGYFGVATVFMFFSSPFENIALVFRHRSAVYIPILLVSVGAVTSLTWVWYSLLTADWFIFVPNFGASLIATVQIVLYFVFHPSKQLAADVAPKDLEASLADSSAVLLHRLDGQATAGSPRVAPVQHSATKPVYGAINA